MNTIINISFTLKDLIHFTFGTISFGVIIYLLLILRELYKLIKHSQEIYSNNRDNINSLIENSSNILNRFNSVTENISKSSVFDSDFKNSFPFIQSIISIVSNIINNRKNN